MTDLGNLTQKKKNDNYTYDDTDETFTMLIKSKEKKVIDAV